MWDYVCQALRAWQTWKILHVFICLSCRRRQHSLVFSYKRKVSPAFWACRGRLRDAGCRILKILNGRPRLVPFSTTFEAFASPTRNEKGALTFTHRNPPEKYCAWVFGFATLKAQWARERTKASPKSPVLSTHSRTRNAAKRRLALALASWTHTHAHRS